MDIVIPLAGNGSRLRPLYKKPKPFIEIGGTTLLEISMLGLPDADNYIFVVRRELLGDLSELLANMKLLQGKSYRIAEVAFPTSGQASSAVHGLKLAKTDAPILISNCDTFFSSDFKVEPGYEGVLGTFESNSPAYSYVEMNGKFAPRTAEKEVISDRASSGLYYFSSKELYLSTYYSFDWPSLGERYIAPMYNMLIKNGSLVGESRIEKVLPLGTPEEIDYAVENLDLISLIEDAKKT